MTPHKTSTKLGSFEKYFFGFVLSIILSVAAYLIVVNNVFSTGLIIASIMILAITQLTVQMVFFLHLGQESKPRWNTMIFVIMLIFVFIIVVGSLWIMHNLNYNMMPTHEMNDYMIEQNKKGF